MKKLVALCLFALIGFGITSCKKTADSVNKATEFDISYTANVPVPATSTVSVSQPVDFTTPNISTGSANRFASEQTTQDLIDEIKLTKFNISNTTAGGNLDALDSLSIYIKTSGIADVLVATKSKIPKGISSVSADLKDVNIKQYIFKENIQFRVTVKVTTGSSNSQSLKMDQTVHVKGKRI